ncbi:short-chain dehydrogenase/reductase family 16C member 6-like isoform X2 [Rhodnius prolixus]|uniref:short-chain dehydrogenase/reductase family 16C member 6-like isoform X2 n=1 Tax=Rhodnius prolixus TaxID=13249 RepID=UPI003D189F8B
MDHSSRDGQSSKETADFKINPTPLENKEFALPLLDLIKIFFISIVLEVPKLLISLIQNLMKKPKSLKDKICLVTGAGRGLGRELCIRLANLKAVVVCVDIRKDINNETVKLIKDSGGKAYGYTCNVAKYEEVTKLAETVQKEVGRVYMLVNNAGLIMTHHACEWPTEEVIAMFNVNVISHFWTIQAFLPSMKEVNEGHIVSLLSSAAIIPTPSISVYSATKAAAESIWCPVNSMKNFVAYSTHVGKIRMMMPVNLQNLPLLHNLCDSPASGGWKTR